jgi:hypothetical protein
VYAESEKGPQYPDALALRPRANLPLAVKHIDIGGSELIQHNVAPLFREGRKLLRKCPVFAKRGRRDLRAFSRWVRRF